VRSWVIFRSQPVGDVIRPLIMLCTEHLHVHQLCADWLHCAYLRTAP
jgi:hypothetical protein